MTSSDSFPRTRPNWSKRIVVTLGCVAIAALIVSLFISRVIKCDEIEEPSIWSPDGRWVVKSMTKACPAGPLSVTNYDVIVTMSASPTASSAKTDSERIFEIDGSSNPPAVTWASPNALVLKVNDEGAVKISRHELANVAINYVVPKWLSDNLGKIETDHLQQNKESEELYKSGKMTADDLRIELQTHQDSAEEWTKFRQWVSENASHESDSATVTPNPQ